MIYSLLSDCASFQVVFCYKFDVSLICLTSSLLFTLHLISQKKLNAVITIHFINYIKDLMFNRLKKYRIYDKIQPEKKHNHLANYKATKS